MPLYSFTDNGNSVTIQIDIQSITIAKNVVDLVLVNDIDNKILEIRTNEYKYKDYEINLDTDTITGVGAGSTTATELRDALEAIFFLDEGTPTTNKFDIQNSIVVNQSNVSTTLGGVIDSTKQYFIDGIVDLGTTQITVPPTGITLKGYSFDISGLTSSEDNYTMFISESIAIGSGNVLGSDYLVSVTGAASKVYELYDATGFNAFEFQRVNYNDCTSLGDIYDYRQGLEDGTGRFGGSPSLTLHGLWRGWF